MKKVNSKGLETKHCSNLIRDGGVVLNDFFLYKSK